MHPLAETQLTWFPIDVAAMVARPGPVRQAGRVCIHMVAVAVPVNRRVPHKLPAVHFSRACSLQGGLWPGVRVVAAGAPVAPGGCVLCSVRIMLGWAAWAEGAAVGWQVCSSVQPWMASLAAACRLSRLRGATFPAALLRGGPRSCRLRSGRALDELCRHVHDAALRVQAAQAGVHFAHGRHLSLGQLVQHMVSETPGLGQPCTPGGRW